MQCFLLGCEKWFWRVDNLRTHYRIQHNLNFDDIQRRVCSDCGIHIPGINSLISHSYECPLTLVSCPTCGHTCHYRDYDSHYIYTHAKKCSECSFIGESYLDLEEHYHNTHTGPHFSLYKHILSRHGGGKIQRGGGSHEQEEFTPVPEGIDVENEHWRLTEVQPKLPNNKSNFGIIDMKLVCVPINTPTLHTHAERISYFNKIFDTLLQTIKSNVGKNVKFRLTLSGGSLDFACNLPFGSSDDYITPMVLDRLSRMLNSNQNFTLDRGFNIQLLGVKSPTGGAYRGQYMMNNVANFKDMETFLRKKRAIIIIPPNHDRMCCAMAIYLGLWKLHNPTPHDKPTRAIYDSLRRNGYGKLAKHATALHHEAKVPIGSMCGVEELELFQAYLAKLGVQLIVFLAKPDNSDVRHFPILYEGLPQEHKIALFLYNEHFNLVTKIPALHGSEQYCFKCHRGFSSIFHHRRCKDNCGCCFVRHTSVQGLEMVPCTECKREFKDRSCYDNHKRINVLKNRTVCEYIKFCQICEYSYKTGSSHRCGRPCVTCGKISFGGSKKKDHQCFMGTDERSKKHHKKYNHIFFDIESAIKHLDKSKNASGYIGMHIPVLIVATKICSSCIQKGVTEQDLSCKVCTNVEFEGEQCVVEFIAWLEEVEQHYSLLLSHNGGKYDLHLLLDEIYKRHQDIKLLDTGLKFLSLTLPRLNITFLDTINFIRQPLANFSKIFQIPTVKGFFPHLFHTVENQDYIGSLPPLEDFGYDSMTGENHKVTGEPLGARAKLKMWHSAQPKDLVYNLKEERRKYCRADVKLHTEGSLKYLKIFQDITDMSFFLEGVTSSQCCLNYFRNSCCPEKTIPILSKNPVHTKDRCSKKELQWLYLQEEELGIRIIKSDDPGGQVKIGRYKVDGFCEETNTVYSFNGCYHHGCDRCYDYDAKGVGGQMAGELFARAMTRRAYILSKGYNVVTMWECDFMKVQSSNPETRAFLKNLDVQPPIEIRECCKYYNYSCIYKN